MESKLQCLLLSSDHKVVPLLRTVLTEIGVQVEHCSETDIAVQKLTRRGFEAVVLDCTTPEIAPTILNTMRSVPANKRAVTVALLEDQATTDAQKALKHVFQMGAHFVLFKPISLERTRTSFRAVRALMKRERRRHARIPINAPVEITYDGDQGHCQVKAVDVGENGIAIGVHHGKMPSSFQLRFTLPGTRQEIVGRGEVAWERGQVVGVRFCELDPDASDLLKRWIERQLAGSDEDLMVSCKLTDLTPNACYLQSESPFPVRTRLQLQMKVGDLELQVDGIVRIMHPGAGMGVEFTQNTLGQKVKVEKFIYTLIDAAGAEPELEVKPDRIDNSASALSWSDVPVDEQDSLLLLFHSKADAPAEVFHKELLKQRSMSVGA
jgi:DNA-binding response OmpR family regulator